MTPLQIASYVIYPLITVLHLYTMNFLIESFLRERDKNHPFYLSVVNICYYICSLFLFLCNGPSMLALIMNVGFTFLITLAYLGNIAHKILLCVILLVTMGGFEAGIVSLITLITNNRIDTSSESKMFFYLVILGKVALFVSAKLLAPLILRFFKRPSNSIPFIYWISILFIPLANMFVIHIFYMQLIAEETINWMACIAIAIMVATTFLVFILYDHILAASTAKYRVVIQEKEIQNYVTAYKNMQEANYKVHEEKHNLKNIAIGLLSCLEPADAQAVALTRVKLEKLVENYQNLSAKSWCDIPIIDAILNTKAAMAKNSNIKLEASVKLNRFSIEDEMMCVLLGNALDNAIEACQAVTDRERVVKLQLLEKNENLFIQIRNPYSGTRKFINGLPLTTKQDTICHGFGMESMRKLVEQHGGMFQAEANGDDFKVNIVLYGTHHVVTN